MSKIINEITITSAKVEKDILKLEWLLNGGDIPLYNGEYRICITEDGIDFFDTQFTTEEGSTKHSVEFSKYTRGKIYRAELILGGISGYCTLIVDTFTQLQGTYKGGAFTFQWEIDSKGFLPGGYCHIEEKVKANIHNKTKMIQDVSGRNAVDFTVNPHYGYWNTDKIRYSREYPIGVTFVGSDGEVCDGPASEELCFYPKGVQILTADISSSQASETLVLTFAQLYEDVPKLCLHFKKGSYLLFQAEAEICKADKQMENTSKSDKSKGDELCQEQLQGENVCKVTVDIPHDKVMPQVLRECIVYCYYKNGHALTKADTAFNSLSLSIPKVQPLALGKQCQCDITMEGERIPSGYEFTDKSIINSSRGKCPADFTARACYNMEGILQRGPWSANGFVPCYYAENQLISYKQKSLGPEEHMCTFPKEWFVNPGTEPIVSGGISLTFGEKECELKIQSDQGIDVKSYDTFLSQIKDIAAPKVFYKINEGILRMGAFAFSDTAHILCSYTPEDKIADLRPGLFMKTETSLYLPPYNVKLKNVDGFVWANTAECEITFTEQGDFLEFNSFAAEMLKSAASSLTLENTEVIYAAGIEDLLRPALRQPYFRMMYPIDMPQQDTAPPYPSNNVILMAADNYGKILKACEDIKERPENINSLSIPVVVFRGRGMLTLMMEIYINERKVHVPVGSSVEQALSKCGVSSMQNVGLYRRAYDGTLLPVFGEIEGIILISGDRMEL